MLSTRFEVEVLGVAAKEFEAAAALAGQAAGRLQGVREMAALNGEDATGAALARLVAECGQAQAAAASFARLLTSNAGVCRGVARAWARRELAAAQMPEPGRVVVADAGPVGAAGVRERRVGLVSLEAAAGPGLP